MHTAALCVRAASFTCAFPITDVVETMRPLPVKALSGAPACVRGVTLARGQPTVVIDVNVLLGGVGGASSVHRFVSLRTSGQPVILAVEAVLGIRDVDLERMRPMPRSLNGHSASQALGVIDQDLMLRLDVQQLLHDAAQAQATGL